MRLENIFSGGPPVIFSSQFHKDLFKSDNSFNRVFQVTASAHSSIGNYNSLIFTLKDISDTDKLIRKYRELKNKALSEVEKRKTAEKKLLKLNKALEIQASTDMLTELYNRRKFSDIINSEIYRIKRSAKPFSVVFLDIDNFKNFNSKYGHDCGDFVLKSTASFIHNSVRITDTVSRWGGEEFIILLPETNIDQALILTEKLRSGIENKTFVYNKKNLNITITFGISMYDKYKDTQDSVINRAESALRQGKKDGKNRIIINNP